MKTECTIGKPQSEATEAQHYHRQSRVGTISESLQEREAETTRVWQPKKNHVYAVSDDQGSLLELYRYTAFGEPEIYSPQTQNKLAGTAIANPVLWNSRRYDEQTDLYYKYRHYKAEIGRWLGRDLIEERGGVNLYGKERAKKVEIRTSGKNIIFPAGGKVLSTGLTVASPLLFYIDAPKLQAATLTDQPPYVRNYVNLDMVIPTPVEVIYQVSVLSSTSRWVKNGDGEVVSSSHEVRNFMLFTRKPDADGTYPDALDDKSEV